MDLALDVGPLVLVEDATLERDVVKSGTPSSFVAFLARGHPPHSGGSLDIDFARELLLCHEVFMDVNNAELVELLQKEWNAKEAATYFAPQTPNVQERIFQVVELWVREYGYQFLRRSRLVCALKSMIEKDIHRLDMKQSLLRPLAVIESFIAPCIEVRSLVMQCIKACVHHKRISNEESSLPFVMRDMIQLAALLQPPQYEKAPTEQEVQHALLQLPQWDAPDGLLGLPPRIIAEQLFVLDHRAFAAVQPSEYLMQRWHRRDREWMSPGLIRCIEQFNAITRWVMLGVFGMGAGVVRGRFGVREDPVVGVAPVVPPDVTLEDIHRSLENVSNSIGDIQQRVQSWIKVLEACVEVKNFAAAVAIVGGLQAPSIYRLKELWKALPEKSMKQFDAIREMLSSERGHLALRNRMAQSIPPLIPHLGIALTDLTFIEDGGGIQEGEGIVRFATFRLIARIVHHMRALQLVECPIEEKHDVTCLLRAIRACAGRDLDRAVYELSLEIQPRARRVQLR